MMKADALVVEASILTMDQRLPVVEAMAIKDGRILAIGHTDELMHWQGKNTRVIRYSKNRAILPGFLDAHLHLRSMMSTKRALDVTCEAAPTLEQVLAAIAREASQKAPGEWILAYGYDESFYAEKRGPSPEMLDEVAPRHPVILRHRTGHEAVLNSLARKELGVLEGKVEADVQKIARLRPPQAYSEREMERSLKELASQLLAHGITGVLDASVTNDFNVWKRWKSWQERGWFPLGLRMFWGLEQVLKHLDQGCDLPEEVRGAKIVLEEDGLHAEWIRQMEDWWGRLFAKGIPVAVHVMDEATLLVVLELLRRFEVDAARLRGPIRLEHASVCAPEWDEELLRLGVWIATQPGFVYYRGDKYWREFPEEVHDWLYPVGRWLEKGIPVLATSDAPVSPPQVFQHLASISDRLTRGGRALGTRRHRLPAMRLLELWTRWPAAAMGLDEAGSLVPGKRADWVVVAPHPLKVPVEEWGSIRVEETYVSGQLQYSL